MTSERHFVGIDLSGTKISTALVHESGEIVAHDYREATQVRGRRRSSAACWTPPAG